MYWSQQRAVFYVTESRFNGETFCYYSSGHQLLIKAQQQAALYPPKLRNRPGIQSVIRYLGHHLKSMTAQRVCGYHDKINCCKAGRHVVSS